MPNAKRAPDDAVMAELQAAIGREAPALELVDPVSEADIRRYANAIADNNPLWHDAAAARRAGYPGPIAPPGLILEFVRPAVGGDRVQDSGLTELYGAASWSLPVPVPAEFSNVRRGEDDIEWLAPARPGDRITVRQHIADVALKEGHTGLLLIVTLAKDYENQRGERLIHQRISSIRRRAVPGETPPPRREPPRRPLPADGSGPVALPDFEAIGVGDHLPPLRFGPLSVVHTVRWAAFTENWYRLHYDRDYVTVHEGERSFIASGGFRQALLCRMLTDWLGPHGRPLRLTVRQFYPTFEGELFVCGGRVVAKSDDTARPTVTCEVWATDGNDRELLRGTAVVMLASERESGRDST